MIRATFIFLILFFTIYIELIFGSFGLVLPAVACAVFYFAVNYGWKLTLIIAIIAGMLLDILFGRGTFYSPFTFIAVTIFGSYWLHKGVVKVVSIQWIPGVMVALISSAPVFFSTYSRYDSGFILLIFMLLKFLSSLILGGLFLPMLVLILDVLSVKFELPEYFNAKKRLYENS